MLSETREPELAPPSGLVLQELAYTSGSPLDWGSGVKLD
jgi:hypothetical protein